MITLDCAGGSFITSPPKHTMSLNCPHCGSLWYSESYGSLWYEADGTYTKLLPSFYPLLINAAELLPVTSELKRLVTQTKNGNDLLFFDDFVLAQDELYRKLGQQLELLTDGHFNRLPATTTLFVDNDSKRPICPDCYAGILEILPF